MGDSLKVLFEIPVATISFSPSGSVSEGTEITVTMSLSKLEADSDTSTRDYIFRADVKESNSGDVDQCEDQANGYGLGVDRHMWKVDEDPETRTGTISADCPVGATPFGSASPLPTTWNWHRTAQASRSLIQVRRCLTTPR